MCTHGNTYLETLSEHLNTPIVPIFLTVTLGMATGGVPKGAKKGAKSDHFRGLKTCCKGVPLWSHFWTPDLVPHGMEYGILDT